MNRRILVTSTDLMMVQFLLPHIRNLSENGYEVEKENRAYELAYGKDIWGNKVKW